MGVKGVLPLGCLPLWGREGVTFPTAEKKGLINPDNFSNTIAIAMKKIKLRLPIFYPKSDEKISIRTLTSDLVTFTFISERAYLTV